MTVPSGVVRVRLTRRTPPSSDRRAQPPRGRRAPPGCPGQSGHELGILRIRARHRLKDAAVGEHRRGARAVITRKQRELGRARGIDRVDAHDLAGLERTVRGVHILALVNLEQLIVALLGKRSRHALKGRSVPGLVRHDGNRHRVDLAVGAEVRKHKHEHR